MKNTDRKTDPRTDVGSTLLLLLDHLVSVTEVVECELFLVGGPIVMRVGRNRLETVDSFLCATRTTVVLTNRVHAIPVKLPTPLKYKRTRECIKND